MPGVTIDNRKINKPFIWNKSAPIFSYGSFVVFKEGIISSENQLRSCSARLALGYGSCSFLADSWPPERFFSIHVAADDALSVIDPLKHIFPQCSWNYWSGALQKLLANHHVTTMRPEQFLQGTMCTLGLVPALGVYGLACYITAYIGQLHPHVPRHQLLMVLRWTVPCSYLWPEKERLP